MVREGLQSPCSLRSVAVFLEELQGASAAYRPWYVGRFELEHSAARNQNHQAQALQATKPRPRTPAAHLSTICSTLK
jgi:hypothetical protein